MGFAGRRAASRGETPGNRAGTLAKRPRRGNGKPVTVGQGPDMTWVIPGQSSVRNGTAGRPAPLYSVAAGLDCHAYLAAFGSGTIGDETTTASPSIVAVAQNHLRSAPATENSPGT